MSLEISKWPLGDKTTFLRTTGPEEAADLPQHGHNCKGCSEHRDVRQGRQGPWDPGQERRPSRKQGSRDSRKAVAGEDTSPQTVLASVVRRISQKSKAHPSGTRQGRPTLHLNLTQGWLPKTAGVSLNEPTSHLCFLKAKVWSFLPGCGKAEGGKATSIACLVLYLLLAQPPKKSQENFIQKRNSQN